jgi:membrane-associated protein
VDAIFDIFLHPDEHLSELVGTCGAWVYVIIFAVVFCETGLVVMPLLPGDSLLFAVGAIAAGGHLSVGVSFVVLCVAAILGDTVNYWIGSRIGPRAFTSRSRFFRREYLERTHRFFEKHGGKTIILARFVPIIRTFAPFVAGVGDMSYRRFVIYNVVGGVTWVALFLFAGYLFGNIPAVKDNFTLVILGIIAVSVVPPIVQMANARRAARRERKRRPSAAPEDEPSGALDAPGSEAAE